MQFNYCSPFRKKQSYPKDKKIRLSVWWKMLFSKTTGYGIRALVYLAGQTEDNLCGLQEIAENEQIPSAYLGKILGELRKHHLLRSVKGVHGGYELVKAPETITIWDVYLILDPAIDHDQCILGLDNCDEHESCALHESWIPLRNQFINLLQTKTIAQIADGLPVKRESGVKKTAEG